MKKLLSVILLLTCALFVNAQTKPKFGHINSADFITKMPGYDTIQTKYKAYYAELENTHKAMKTELETKYQEYLANKANMTELIRSFKEKEISDLQMRLEEFEASISDELQDKETALTKPLLDRFRKAVEDVAKEGKYTYIFDTRLPILLFAEPSEDITDLVKAKLGMK